MGDYRLNGQAVLQRSYAEGKRFGNMKEYLLAQAANDAFDADATVIAVSTPESQSIMCLNSVAGFVLEATMLGRDVAWMVETLGEIFEVDEEELESDIEEIISDMVDRGILVS